MSASESQSCKILMNTCDRAIHVRMHILMGFAKVGHNVYSTVNALYVYFNNQEMTFNEVYRPIHFYNDPKSCMFTASC